MASNGDKFFLAERKAQQKGIGNKIRKVTEKKEDLKSSDDKVKKPFDKKTYRLKKYSKKYKLDQWEEQRKKKLLRDYYKETKNDPMVGTYKAKDINDDGKTEIDSGIGKFVRHPDMIEKDLTAVTTEKKKDPYWKAKEQYKKIKQEKVDKRNEIEKNKEEKKQKLLEYKKKKADRFKKLSKKTKKGQPVMTGRLELLLEKIQKKT